MEYFNKMPGLGSLITARKDRKVNVGVFGSPTDGCREKEGAMRVILILFLISLSSTCWGETYRWVDDKGTIHFTEDYGSIPEKYRGRVQERKDKPGESAPKTDEKLRKAPQVDSIRIYEGSPMGSLTEEEPVNKNRIESGAAESLRMILSLVKDGRYEDLYEYGTDSSRASMPKEHFVRGMKGKSSVLAPSWEAIQDISAKFRSPTLVHVTAKIGYKLKRGDTLGNTLFTTSTYPMELEGGGWKTSLSKILSTPP